MVDGGGGGEGGLDRSENICSTMNAPNMGVWNTRPEQLTAGGGNPKMRQQITHFIG